jgi:transcriptional regulator with XRE-family HTH domain
MSSNSVDQAIGHAVRILRIQKGITLGECAKTLAVREPDFVAFETGEARISASQLFALAKLFSEPMSSFFASVDI